MRELSIQEEVLVEGLDDWVYASWVYGCAADSRSEDYPTARSLAIGTITELIVKGLMTPGDIRDGRHQPWALDIGDAIIRIVDLWLLDWPDSPPSPGAIVWLSNTESGNVVAREALERRRKF